MTRLASEVRTLAAAALVAVTAYAAPASAQGTGATAAPAAPAAAPAAADPVAVPGAAAPAGVPVAAPPQILMVAPRTLEWEKGEPIPPGYHPSTEVIESLVIAGSVTLGVMWIFGGVLPGILGIAGCDAIDSAGGDIGCAPGFGVLIIPVIGPFISAALFGADGTLAGAGAAVLVVDGIVQSAGAAMLIAGLVVQNDILLRDDAIGSTHIKWKPTPMAVGTGYGVGIVGSF